MPIQINDIDGLTESAFERAEGDLAIGYVRISSKKPMKMKLGDANIQFKHNFNNRIEYNQYNAIRYYCHSREILCLGWFIERQSSSGTDDQESFGELRELIKICLNRNITLAYCELGSTLKHPEFFALIRHAKKIGVKVTVVRDGKVMNVAKTHIKPLHAKVFTKKGDGEHNKFLKEITRREQDPFNEFKIANKISTRRFRTLEHLVDDADPIFRFFLTEETMYSDNPEEWKASKVNNKVISRELHERAHLTVEGYRWNNELVRRAKLLVLSVLFKNFFIEKQMVRELWEDGIGKL